MRKIDCAHFHTTPPFSLTFCFYPARKRKKKLCGCSCVCVCVCGKCVNLNLRVGYNFFLAGSVPSDFTLRQTGFLFTYLCKLPCAIRFFFFPNFRLHEINVEIFSEKNNDFKFWILFYFIFRRKKEKKSQLAGWFAEKEESVEEQEEEQRLRPW